MSTHSPKLYASGQFPATVGRRRVVRGARLTETRYAAGATLPRHAHEQAYFVFVVDGLFAETVAGQSRHCGPRTLIARPRAEPHEDRFGPEGGRCLNVELDNEWLEELGHTGFPPASAVDAGPAVGTASRLHDEFLRSDSASTLAIEGLMLELAAELARLPESDPGCPVWLSHARAALDEWPAAPLSLAELALELGVRPVRLARAFRRRFGRTPAAYVRERRLELAGRELARSDRPLAEVALLTGFCDQSHFTRAFRRAWGTTPAAYRAARRRPPDTRVSGPYKTPSAVDR